MSIAKSVAGFLFSSLFIITLYLSITSFTIGSLLQKENIKNFVENQMKGEIATQTCEKYYCSGDFDIQKCQEYCNYLDTGEHIQQCKDACVNNSYQSEAKQKCVDSCLSIMSNETKERAYKTLDDIYSKKVVDGISLDSIMPILRNTLLFIVLCLIFGISLFFVSDKPVSKIGNDIVVVSISMLAIAVIPIFIISPDVPILKMVTDYVLESFYTQLFIGATLLIIGIILIVIGKKKGK